jgi:hypothetical protein
MCNLYFIEKNDFENQHHTKEWLGSYRPCVVPMHLPNDTCTYVAESSCVFLYHFEPSKQLIVIIIKWNNDEDHVNSTPITEHLTSI